ncbi:isoleucine--tRNA ligase [Bartonella sp. DGB1]|uniref:isoleucine--tRNA ligase n=1 Tax=Bartonella sp. DGB1 TaxID=3239807 RepID=UPI0035249FB5
MDMPKIDYSKSLYLPQTDFSMRASLAEKEPELLQYWQDIDLYGKLRKLSVARPVYLLHDGPPYANGNIHIGHALNKILKDIVIRSKQMQGFNANYVPGWDCHGLPIEWKIEEKYRASGKNKDEVPITEFRQECRDFAAKWIKIQSEEFIRLGVIGDFKNPYTTMNYRAESLIAGELIKFAGMGQLYRGSKPIMWSVVEKTALAEAEIEYHEYESDTIWVKFPIVKTNKADIEDASIVIWTTTPWTIPANRAVAYSPNIEYALYQVTEVENDFGPKVGEKLIFAKALYKQSADKAKLTLTYLRDITNEELENMMLAHPLKGFAKSYNFKVPLLVGSYVSDDAGTGFVHTAPGHGREDFDLWFASAAYLQEQEIDINLPFTVNDDGFFTSDAPGFSSDRAEGAARVIDDKGKKGNANQVVITALIEHDNLFARGRLKHSYPHSWRSKKPIIFRNTPQWFVPMDREFEDGTTLRSRALEAIDKTMFIPETGRARLRAMIADRPDWVLSRQRSWGVPIAIFVNENGDILKDEKVNQRILEAFENEGADVWFTEGARERFLQERSNEDWQQVKDILDVWFESGTTHKFVLNDRKDLTFPADLYLEGSDQHRGWFHSSLLESCGTNGIAPYKAVLTHGFTLDEKGRKMSKSLGNSVAPQDVIKNVGADVLRLWVATVDYWDDQRLGRNIIQTNVDSYRKLRNVFRWMLGTLVHYDGKSDIAINEMPELEQLMHYRLLELNKAITNYYNVFDFKRVARILMDFAIVELSAFYFDIRKDSLYCDAPSSSKRQAALQTIDRIFRAMALWLAPILPFTMEEAWRSRYPNAESIHLELFVNFEDDVYNDELVKKWQKIKNVRRVVTGALELERMQKNIGSSLEAKPIVYLTDENLFNLLKNIDFAEVVITSDIELTMDKKPDSAFILDDNHDIAVVVEKAKGKKCSRSWRYTEDVGLDPEFKDVSMRDAQALRELIALGKVKLAEVKIN